MATDSRPEVWLRGPLPGIPAHLQPVAHGLLQCREEVRRVVSGLTSEQIMLRPGGVGSVGFHVRHAIGSLDRLFTYARGEQLSAAQLAVLANESDATAGARSGAELVLAFHEAIEQALVQLGGTRESTLLEPRDVGRGRLPSTVLGLLFHAAEHTQRHIGQMVTTARLA